MPAVKAVLFDLDGTLLDTAPDLAAALNIQLSMHNHPDVPFTDIRPLASHGSKALIKLGFKLDADNPLFAGLREEFLQIYKAHSCHFTELFAGMAEVLQKLESTKIKWGIVTNKPGWLTLPILKKLGLIDRAACIVCGDTLTVSKPEPAPLLYACELLHIKPEECLYIGDAEFDMVAGKRAGIKTVLAAYGYLSTQDKVSEWPVDTTIKSPTAILKLLNLP